MGKIWTPRFWENLENLNTPRGEGGSNLCNRNFHGKLGGIFDFRISIQISNK